MLKLLAKRALQAGLACSLIGAVVVPAANASTGTPSTCVSPTVAAQADGFVGKNASAEAVNLAVEQYAQEDPSAATPDVTSMLESTMCLQLLGGSTVPTVHALDSVNTDVSVSANVYYDDQADEYYVIGDWSWLNDAYYDEEPCEPACSTANVGPPDGWGISTNQKVDMLGEALAWWPNSGDPFQSAGSTEAATQVNANGAAFRQQDIDDLGMGLNVYNGEEVIDFSGLVSGTCSSNFQAFFTYGHTWSSTSISDITLNSDGVDITFTSSSHSWKRGTQSNITTVC